MVKAIAKRHRDCSKKKLKIFPPIHSNSPLHCPFTPHLRMASESPDIVSWATSELPLVPLPTAEDLNNLTAGPAARELWHFLTTRVLSLPHAQRAHAALAVTSGSYRVTESDDELEGLRNEIAQVENELDALREQLRKECRVVCGGGAVAEEEIREAGGRELKAIGERILEHVKEGIEKVETVGRMERVGEEKEEEKAWEEGFLDLLSEICAVWMHAERDTGGVEDRLKEEIETVGLGRVCEVLMSEVRRNMVEVRGWKGEWLEGTVEDVEAVARNLQQRAFKEYEEVWKESERSLEKVEKEVTGIREANMGTLLRAQEEGERAVLQFAERGVDEQSAEIWGKLRREVGRGNERVAEIFRACGEMRAGSRVLLDKAWETRKRVIEDVKEMERMKVEGLEGVDRGVEAVIRAGEKIDEMKLKRAKEEMEDSTRCFQDIERIRRDEAESVEQRVLDTCEDVEKRGRIAEELWARTMENMENGLLKRVEKLVEEAKGVQESDVKYVQEELRNWIKSPGGEAARTLGLIDGSHQ